MKRIVLTILGALLVALGGVAAVAADPGNGNGPPAAVPGSPGDDCSHGASDKDCRPDPQPTHGQDCDDHGNARGNEDHCGPTETPPPTDTTPTDTTPTTPVETTPVETTPTTPEVTTSPPTSSVPESVATAPATTTTSATPGPAPAPAPSPRQKAVAKAKATKVVKVVPKANGVVVVTTADGRKHVGIMGSG